MSERHAGLILPLFSARSTEGWGIGELPDLVPLAQWMRDAGLDRLMVLPLGTMQPGESSPYSSASTLSIDPIYIAVDRVPEFARAGGIGALSEPAAAALARARRASEVDYDAVRLAKEEALSRAFRVFLAEEWQQLTTRASDLAGYIARERWWLDDYALFQVLARRRPGVSWTDWPDDLRHRDAAAIDRIRRELQRELLEQQYWQWIAETQWRDARTIARGCGVRVIGDLPFVAATESADVWAHAEEFRLDVSVGCPPDAFSPTGQDWGLPAYDWEVIARSGYGRIRQRAQRMAALFDGIRVDHLVGLYRTYGRPRIGEPFFNPDQPDAQRAQGQAILTVVLKTGLEIIAEDLGTIPDFVRESLASLQLPGCKVLRWERDWHAEGAPFLDPGAYPPASAAMSGTHDTEALADWWDAAPVDEREAFLKLPFVREAANADSPWTDRLRDAILRLLCHSSSRCVFFPLQDIFGWRDRVNTPATVGPHNWTWSLPWPVDDMAARPEAVERAAALGRFVREAGRRAEEIDLPGESRW